MEKMAGFFQTSVCKILFPYTVELARRGKYKEAEVSLKFVLEHDSSPEYFILLGKVYAQQGKYEDAIAEWKRVLEINPENGDARAAILKAENLTKKILPSHIFKWRLIAGVLGLLLALSGGMSLFLWKGKADIVIKYEDSLRNEQALLTGFQRLEDKFKSIEEENEKLEAEYQNLTKSYEDLERKTGGQLVMALKIRHRLAQIKGLGSLKTIIIKQKDRHVEVSGEVSTRYLKNLIERTFKELKGVESVDVKGLKVTHQYFISKGDALSKISEEIYGNHRKWKKIFEANKDKIKDPDIIRPSDSLYIP